MHCAVRRVYCVLCTEYRVCLSTCIRIRVCRVLVYACLYGSECLLGYVCHYWLVFLFLFVWDKHKKSIFKEKKNTAYKYIFNIKLFTNRNNTYIDTKSSTVFWPVWFFQSCPAPPPSHCHSLSPSLNSTLHTSFHLPVDNLSHFRYPCFKQVWLRSDNLRKVASFNVPHSTVTVQVCPGRITPTPYWWTVCSPGSSWCPANRTWKQSPIHPALFTFELLHPPFHVPNHLIFVLLYTNHLFQPITYHYLPS